MIDNKKIVICIPAGRQRYLEVLIKFLEKEFDIIDEVRFWLNTKNESDRKYIYDLSNKNSKYTIDTTAFGDPNEGQSHTIGLFFKNCIDEDTIYIRFDDDIVFLEKNFIRDLVTFRINNPEYYLVLGNIVNNCVSDYQHKQKGALKTELNIEEKAPCDTNWPNSDLAIQKHLQFFEHLKNNRLDLYKFENKKWNHHYSVNAICWMGSEFKKTNGYVVYGDEEIFLTSGKNNIIFGEKVCCHYSFFITRDKIDENTQILNEYKLLSETY